MKAATEKACTYLRATMKRPGASTRGRRLTIFAEEARAMRLFL
jgi:hypothetical protein